MERVECVLLGRALADFSAWSSACKFGAIQLCRQRSASEHVDKHTFYCTHEQMN